MALSRIDVGPRTRTVLHADFAGFGVPFEVAAVVGAVSGVIVGPVVGPAYADKVLQVRITTLAVGQNVVNLQLPHRFGATLPGADALQGEERDALVHRGESGATQRDG